MRIRTLAFILCYSGASFSFFVLPKTLFKPMDGVKKAKVLEGLFFSFHGFLFFFAYLVEFGE